MPESVIFIGSAAFSENMRLISVTIPNSVTEIESGAFSSCPVLANVTVARDTPLPVPDNMFSSGNPADMNILAATLHVPAYTTALYRAASVWKDFGTIVEYDPASIGQVEPQTLKAFASNGMLYITGIQSGKPLRVFNISGQPVYNGIAKAATEQIPLASHGMYIITSGEQTVKVIMP